MVAIFHDMNEKTMEVFMMNIVGIFLVILLLLCLPPYRKKASKGVKTQSCAKLGKMPLLCQGMIFLGHKISKSGIEVDKSKVDVISKIASTPTTVKGSILVAPIVDLPLKSGESSDIAVGAS
ncbi:hypothetical protein Tco_0066776 [Tanacetum coccineum]